MNQLYAHFDRVLQYTSLEKIKTTGNKYIIAGGSKYTTTQVAKAPSMEEVKQSASRLPAIKPRTAGFDSREGLDAEFQSERSLHKLAAPDMAVQVDRGSEDFKVSVVEEMVMLALTLRHGRRFMSAFQDGPGDADESPERKRAGDSQPGFLDTWTADIKDEVTKVKLKIGIAAGPALFGLVGSARVPQGI